MVSLDDVTDDLLIQILSLLPTISAVQTSVISRRYRDLWSTLPSLSFTHRQFSNAVNQTLLRRRPNHPIHTFLLECDFKEKYHYSSIESWIIYAVNHGAVNLTVDFFDRDNSPDDEDDEDENPIFLFYFDSLRKSLVRVLSISRCYLEWPGRNLELDSIREIYLDWILMDRMFMYEMLSGCANLERLGLRYAWSVEHVRFFGDKMKWLSIKNFDCDSLEIDCPNLEFLEIKMVKMVKFVLKTTSLVEANVSFAYRLDNLKYWGKVMSLLGHVQKLKVQNWWYKLLKTEEYLSPSFILHNLRWLELKSIYTIFEVIGIALILPLSPNLETLILDGDRDGDAVKIEAKAEDDCTAKFLKQPINLSLPKLRLAKIKSFTGTQTERLFLDMLKKQAKACQKIVVVHVENGNEKYPYDVWVRSTANAQGSTPEWELLWGY